MASTYGIECWFGKQGGVKREIDSLDYSEPYEVDEASVFELNDGRFAVVTERGCSCYSYDDADIEYFETEESAMAEFNKLKKT